LVDEQILLMGVDPKELIGTDLSIGYLLRIDDPASNNGSVGGANDKRVSRYYPERKIGQTDIKS